MPTSKPGAKTAPLERQNYPLERQAKAQFELIARAYEGGAFDDLVDRRERDPVTRTWRPVRTSGLPLRAYVPGAELAEALLARIEGFLGEEMLPRVARVAYKHGSDPSPDIWADLRLHNVGKAVRRRHANREKRRRQGGRRGAARGRDRRGAGRGLDPGGPGRRVRRLSSLGRSRRNARRLRDKKARPRRGAARRLDEELFEIDDEPLAEKVEALFGEPLKKYDYFPWDERNLRLHIVLWRTRRARP